VVRPRQIRRTAKVLLRGSMTRIAAILGSLALVGTPYFVSAGDAPAPNWNDASAIFKLRCTMCHSDLGASKGLRLDSYEAAIAGSERGAVLLPGDSENSELVRRLRGVSVPRMPFLGRQLPDEEIELIVRWIDAGLRNAP
jgi:mono/diheme cytochrome c family protein